MSAPRTTLQRKLVTAMMTTSTAVLVLVGAILVAHDVTSFRRFLVEMLVTRANILASNCSASLAFQNPDDASQVLRSIRNDPNMVAAALYDESGRLFAFFPENAPGGTIPTLPGTIGHRFAAHHLMVFQPVVEDGRRLGTIYLYSGLRALDQRLRVELLVLLLAVLGSAVVALALSTWLQRRIAHPLVALTTVVRSVSETRDYSVRARIQSDDEVGVLAESFDTMIGEIQRRDREIRTLNADLERRVAARTAELEASNKEMEAFSYSVSHDLRAPLRHVDGFVELLSKHLGSTLDEKGRKYIATISGAAKRMGNLIDDLLVFSRMGRSEMRTTSVDLGALTDEVIQELKQDEAGRKVEWKVGRLPAVQGDPAMLRQVLANLLSNALKYTGPQEKARIEVVGEAQNGEIVVSVRDNGVGFDATYAHKLFGVFQRLHTNDEFEGTGIGLANVRRIVSRHGGRTWAEGAVGHGATFFFTLPRHEVAA